LLVLSPQGGGRGEVFEADFGFDGAVGGRAVVEEEAVAVGAEDERNVQDTGVVEGLHHASPYGVLVVLGLNNGNGNVGLEVEDVVSALGLAAGSELAFDVDFAVGEGDFFEELAELVPTGLFEGGRDVLGTDVALGEVFLG